MDDYSEAARKLASKKTPKRTEAAKKSMLENRKRLQDPDVRAKLREAQQRRRQREREEQEREVSARLAAAGLAEEPAIKQQEEQPE